MSDDPVAVVSTWSRTDHVPVPSNWSGPMLSENGLPVPHPEADQNVPLGVDQVQPGAAL